jgi:hypothetical protein
MVERFSEVPAMARMSPPSMAARDTGIGLKPSLTWPAIRSVVSGCDALYGMNWTLRPAARTNISAARWLTEPMLGRPIW